MGQNQLVNKITRITGTKIIIRILKINITRIFNKKDKIQVVNKIKNSKMDKTVVTYRLKIRFLEDLVTIVAKPDIPRDIVKNDNTIWLIRANKFNLFTYVSQPVSVHCTEVANRFSVIRSGNDVHRVIQH